MSKTIDERVVSMKFDNKNFESNVQTSLSTLDKLKKSLKLDGASKGLENVGAAAKNVDFNPLSSGVEAVKTRFSALEVMAVTALVNITNSAINAGKSIASALTIDPIKTGLQEYETKMNAIQVIQANTRGKNTMSDITEALDELNTYADKTIYNFAQMTSNIGKFTAQGLDARQAAKAVQGLANLAAASGASAEDMSRATYQMSQALGGTIKLMDWNSLRNANMATTTLKDTLIDVAAVIGKIDVKKMIEDEGSFENTLSKGWLSGNLFTEAMNIYSGVYSEAELKAKGFSDAQVANFVDLAQMAASAATEVKTVTQLWDVLKETAQSGWTQSWEYIIGDFDTAKRDLTALQVYFSDMINASSDARNAILKGWSEAGGRATAIEALKNAFFGVMNVIKPIKEAFREIFPPMTANTLIKITEKVKEMTQSFRDFTEKNGPNIKSTFKGIFAVIDIGVELFKAIGSGAISLLKNFTGLGDGVLGITGSFGDWLVHLRDSIKESNIFNNIIKTLVTILQNGINGVKSFASGLKQSIVESELFGKSVNGIGGFLKTAIEKVKEFAKAVSSHIPAPSFEGFANTLKTIGEIGGKVVSKIVEIGKAIGKALKDALSGGAISGGLDIVNGGIFASILLSLKKAIDGGGLFDFIDSFKEKIESIKHPLSFLTDKLAPVTGVLDGLKGCLQAYQEQLKANILLKISGAIAILAGSLLLIAMIEPDRLNGSIKAMTSMFVDLVGAMALLNKFGGDGKLSGKLGLTATATALIEMSAAVLILSGAMKTLSTIDPERMTSSLVGIGVLLGELVATSAIMTKSESKMVKGSIGIVLLAASLKILASVCKDFSEMSWEEIGKGLTGVGALLAELVATSVILSMNESKMTKGSVGLVLMAAALKILANVCQDFASMSWEEIGKGLAGVGGLLLELAAFSVMTSNSKHILSTGASLVLIAASMKIFASAMADFASMSWEEIGRGLTAMGGALLEVAIAVNLMPKNMILIGTGLAIVSASLLLLADALGQMGGMSWEEIGKGLVTLGGSMLILAIGLNAMNGTLAGSAALVIAAAGLALLVPVLKSLDEMSWGSLIKSMLAMGLAFGVLAAAGMLLTPAVPGILAFGAAIALVGAGVLMAGAGIALLNANLLEMTELMTGTTGFQLMIESFKMVIALIPYMLEQVGKGIVALVKSIGDGAGAIIESVVKIGSALLTALNELVPQIVEVALNLIDKLLTSLAEHAPSIIQAGFDILIALLEGISNNIGQIVDVVGDIIINFMTAISEKLPEIAQAGVDIVISLIDGLANGLVENAARLNEAMTNLCEAMLECVLIFFGIHSPSTVFAEIGENLIQGLINGIGNLKDSAISTVKTLASNLVTSISEKKTEFMTKGSELMDNLKSGISSKMSAVKTATQTNITNCISEIQSKMGEFKTKGSNLMDNLKTGISSKLSAVKSAAKEVASGALSSIRDKVSEFKTIGSNMMSGLAEGISSGLSWVKEAATNVVSKAISAAKKKLDINSPSKVFRSMGYSIDEGLVVGINKFGSDVEDASRNIASRAIDSARDAMSNLGNVVNGSFTATPTISPVVNMSNAKLSNIQLGASIASFVARPVDSLSQLISDAQSEINASNREVIDAIVGLRSDMAAFYNVDSEIGLYVDSKKLATALAKPMNRQLNILSKRGAY